MPRIYSVKIFGQKYKIDYNHSDQDSYGMCFSDRNRISIRHKLPEDKLQRVLMHEVTHAVIHETPLSLRKRFDVEEVCDIVGYHIIDTLQNNPQLVEWLFAKPKEEEETNG